MTKNKLLNIQDLHIHFNSENGQQKAVNDLNFELFEGEILGIVGESGSGKSLTALSIMKLLPKKSEVSGTIKFQRGNKSEVNIIDLKPSETKSFRGAEIAMIFQEPMTSLNPVFKCGEQISEAIQLHQKISKEEAKKQVFQLLDKVKLTDVDHVFHAYPHQISGGQKQRVMIAMALSCQPKILIADEPTTALDVTVQKTILNLLKDLQKEFQMSIIFISHDLGVIAEICNRVLVMNNGKIVEKGEVKSIFKSPTHPYTKGLLACRPSLNFSKSRLPTLEDFLTKEAENNIAKEVSKVPKRAQKKAPKSEKTIPFLRVKNLKKWFPKKKNFLQRVHTYTKAVNDVSFDIFEGETLGLVGESGCGKTTLGRTILKLTEATDGQIFYEGKNILTLSEPEFRPYRRDFQIIFQDPYSSLNPRQSIGQSILEPLIFHELVSNKREGKDRVVELLEMVGMKPDHYNRMPHQFSGGQRQRICIARALSTKPKFVVCDECVSSLDVSVQAQILNLLLDLKEEQNLTYIFISHDLSVVRFMSNRIIVMNNGKIEEIGASEEIYNNPKSSYTQQLLNAIPKGL